jgi:hypothetical protein
MILHILKWLLVGWKHRNEKWRKSWQSAEKIKQNDADKVTGVIEADKDKSQQSKATYLNKHGGKARMHPIDRIDDKKYEQ